METNTEANELAMKLEESNKSALDGKKKLLGAVLGSVIVCASTYLGLPSEIQQTVIIAISSLFGIQITGQTFIDRIKEKK